MATNAQEIDLILLKHALIRRTMGRMTGHAAFNFCFMLVDVRPLFLGVALVADLVPSRIRPQLFGAKSPVRTVTIVALDQSLVHTVAEGARKFSPDIHVTRETKFRRLRLHQELTFLGTMRRMTIEATYAVCQVHRAVIVPMLFGVLMAAQTASAGLLRRGVLKGKDFGLIASAVDVLFPRAMTSLAAMPLRAFVCVELRVHGGGEVGRSGEMRIDVFMACLAGIGTNV